MYILAGDRRAGVSMPFSWRGILIAPATVPAIFAVLMAIFLGRGSLGFLLLAFVMASLVSYSVTIFVFLPVYYALSRIGRMTLVTTSLLGLALGMAGYIPWTWFLWNISGGSDPGPPKESYLSFLLNLEFEPLTLVFVPAGLITAALYYWLGTRRQG